MAIFGVGGVGGYAAEALVRSGIGAITLYDDDRVCLTNLNRQLIATRAKPSANIKWTRWSNACDINPNVRNSHL
ncbi:MAG: ThiF family adenylyltransferase [Christensenellales bacterium]